jgi:hypothetical protein
MILPPLTNGSWNSGPPLVRLPWLGRLGLLVRAASLAWIGHRVARVQHWGDRRLAGQMHWAWLA